jgi:hypothetical protein
MSKKIGRPKGQSIFLKGKINRVIVSLIKSCGGLTATRDRLIIEGVQLEKGKQKERLFVSLPTLVKVAQQAKIKLHRGRKKLQFAG